jgi:hypothetical protein
LYQHHEYFIGLGFEIVQKVKCFRKKSRFCSKQNLI